MIHSKISNAKNQLQTPEAFAQAAGDFYSRTAARVYTKYQELLNQNNALDFGDLLMRTTLSLRDHPQVLKELQDRFTYILIDEYQDTNHVQYVLAHALALRHKNICVVGDPDQSIYAWRGADIQNILDFEKDYPDAKVVKLEQNYRSTKTILHLASTLIGHNAQRRDKKLWTENAPGDKAKVFYAADEYEEANLVAAQLKELAEKHNYQWSQMAIFYRMNSLSRVMEDALRKENLPYVMARGVEFYNRKEIKDTLAYLRVIANPADEMSLERIVNVPARGIGDSSVKQMKTFAIATGISLWNAMERAGEVTGLSSRAINSTRAFVELVTSWRTLAAQQKCEELEPGQKGPVQTLMEDVVRRSGLEAFYKKEGGDEQEERSNIDQLITSAAEFDHENATATLDEYLSMISLVSDIDHLKGNGGAITMMTLHAAKGLEFPVVAMIGLEEGCLPHARAREDGAQLEEERRLAFVGITRAQERLILTKSSYRTIRGLRERTIPSQFLTELPADAMEIEDRSGQSQSGWRSPQFTRTDTDIEAPPTAQFRQGQMVRHPTFGIGRIAEVTDAGQHTRAVVQFNQAGRKTLILQYARLEAVG